MFSNFRILGPQRTSQNTWEILVSSQLETQGLCQDVKDLIRGPKLCRFGQQQQTKTPLVVGQLYLIPPEMKRVLFWDQLGARCSLVCMYLVG